MYMTEQNINVHTNISGGDRDGDLVDNCMLTILDIYIYIIHTHG